MSNNDIGENNEFSFESREFGLITLIILENNDSLFGNLVEISWNSDNNSRTWSQINIDSKINFTEFIKNQDEIENLVNRAEKFNRKEVTVNNIKIIVEKKYDEMNEFFNCSSKDELIQSLVDNHFHDIHDSMTLYLNGEYIIDKISYQFYVIDKDVRIFWMYDIIKQEIYDFLADNLD